MLVLAPKVCVSYFLVLRLLIPAVFCIIDLYMKTTLDVMRILLYRRLIITVILVISVDLLHYSRFVVVNNVKIYDSILPPLLLELKQKLSC
jgi:hypothetical protein